MTKLTVDTFDLRCALKAVAPHAGPDPEFPPLHRVRLAFDTVNITVAATNSLSAALGLVSIEESDQPLPGYIDLSPKDVRDILSQFPGARRGNGFRPADDEDDHQQALEIAWSEQHLTVTDVSGLFPGKSLRLVRYADDQAFPRLERIVAGMLARPFTGDEKQARRLSVQGKFVSLFQAAAKAYREPLVLEPTGANGSIVVSCGESFIGALMPVKQDEVGTSRLNDWRKAWVERLPQVSVQEPLDDIPEPENGDGNAFSGDGEASGDGTGEHLPDADDQGDDEHRAGSAVADPFSGAQPADAGSSPSADDTAPEQPAAPDDAELLRSAAELVVTTGLGSTSMLQRKLKIGHAKAGDLMSKLWEHGVVDEGGNGRSRKVLDRPEQLQEVLDRLPASS